MCKFVTIVVGIISDIGVFFNIFMVGNIAFATAILHMLRGCSLPGLCTEPVTDFPSNYFLAITSTLFFMVSELARAFSFVSLLSTL